MTPSPNDQPPNHPPTAAPTGFFDQIQAEIQAQSRHVRSIESRIGDLNVEREQVQQGIKKLKNSGTLVRTLRKKLLELRDTLRQNIETQQHYLGRVEKLGAIETLQPLLQEIQESYREKAELGRQIQACIQQSEEEANLCAEISTLLSVWSEQNNPPQSAASVDAPVDPNTESGEPDPDDATVPSVPLAELGEVNIEPAEFDLEKFWPEDTLLEEAAHDPIEPADTLHALETEPRVIIVDHTAPHVADQE